MSDTTESIKLEASKVHRGKPIENCRDLAKLAAARISNPEAYSDDDHKRFIANSHIYMKASSEAREDDKHLLKMELLRTHVLRDKIYEEVQQLETRRRLLLESDKPQQSPSNETPSVQ